MSPTIRISATAVEGKEFLSGAVTRRTRWRSRYRAVAGRQRHRALDGHRGGPRGYGCGPGRTGARTGDRRDAVLFATGGSALPIMPCPGPDRPRAIICARSTTPGGCRPPWFRGAASRSSAPASSARNCRDGKHWCRRHGARVAPCRWRRRAAGGSRDRPRPPTTACPSGRVAVDALHTTATASSSRVRTVPGRRRCRRGRDRHHAQHRSRRLPLGCSVEGGTWWMLRAARRFREHLRGGRRREPHGLRALARHVRLEYFDVTPTGRGRRQRDVAARPSTTTPCGSGPPVRPQLQPLGATTTEPCRPRRRRVVRLQRVLSRRRRLARRVRFVDRGEDVMAGREPLGRRVERPCPKTRTLTCGNWWTPRRSRRERHGSQLHRRAVAACRSSGDSTF